MAVVALIEMTSIDPLDAVSWNSKKWSWFFASSSGEDVCWCFPAFFFWCFFQ